MCPRQPGYQGVAAKTMPQDAPPRWAEFDDVRLAYELSGPATGLGVAFAHGLGSRRQRWAPIAAAVAERRPVLTWDLRGHGDSSAPDSAYTFAETARDLARLLDHVGWARAIVVGHSLGGIAAQRFALDYPPGRAAGLAMIATSSEVNAAAVAGWERQARVAEALAVRQPPPADAPPELVGMVQARLRHTAPVAYIRVARGLAQFEAEPLTPRLGRIVCPTLIVVGERDPIGVGGSVIMQRRIPGAQLAILPDLGHEPQREDPAAVLAVLLPFLDALPST